MRAEWIIPIELLIDEATQDSQSAPVTRFEVIDHRSGTDVARVFVATDVTVRLVYQDNGRTLKVFLGDLRPDG